jgi:transglutaminase-like putative cysteine protease
MFVARMVFIRQRNQWKESNTYTPPYIGVDFVRVTIVVITALLLFSWAAPGLAKALPAAQDAWRQVKQPWSQVRNTFDNAFASLRSTVGIVTDYYGPNLSLGRGNRMSDAQIFSVITPPDPPDGTRFYWRARVYDTYENGWRSTFSTNETVNPENFDFLFPDTSDDISNPSTFSFTTGSHIATLLTAQQPVWVSRPAKVELTYNPDGTADVGLIRADPPLKAGETYTVRSSLNRVTIADLRNAGTDYPEWIKSKYLQIPDNLTPRTIELAQRIAVGEETPYDIAFEITRYLRTNIEYTETVPPLPTNQELIDWFLFDIKQGFCNYYATSEVIMLRSLGIPARLGVGYAQGESIEDVPDAFYVRQRDAHAWPEVYFPGIGWVEFEPTVSQPLLVRPVGELLNQDNDPRLNDNPNNFGDDSFRENPFETRDEEAAIAANSESSITSLNVFAISAGLMLVLILLSIPFLKRKGIHEKIPQIPVMVERGFHRIGLKPPAFLRHWAQYGRLGPLPRAYTEINMALNRLGNPPSSTQTPAERATSLATTLPEAASPTNLLIGEYQAATYSHNYNADIEVARNASIEIRNLSFKAVLQRLWKRFSIRFQGRDRTY